MIWCLLDIIILVTCIKQLSNMTLHNEKGPFYIKPQFIRISVNSNFFIFSHQVQANGTALY